MASITHFSQLQLEGSYTYADYLTWEFPERVELILGRIFKMSPAPSRGHQKILRKLTSSFDAFINKTSCGCDFYFAPFDVRLPNKHPVTDREVITVLQPDFIVVCDLSKLDERGCLGAPDLVAEILSPGNSRREMGEKYRIYESSGVKEYWVVDPEGTTVHRYVLHEGVFIGLSPVSPPEVLTTALFPGWEIPLEDLFSE